ncbi:hypothetical protein Tco_0703716 [Tanacetum coccineum]|uniref:Uncharacterized protein n=1 Tax=Tanacetum coccineum TaxID=301880 RepID=A0ABQ4XZM3_9ASTR
MEYEEIEVVKILGMEDNATDAFTKVVPVFETVTTTNSINRSLCSALEKNTPIDLWDRDYGGRKLSLRWNFKADRDEGNVSLSKPLGYRKEDDMAAYAFDIAEEEDTHAPITF